MTILRVGLDKQFLYISDAYDYASNGDTLFIDEGIYIEQLVIDGKIVNLLGDTESPEEGNITVYYNAVSNESVLQIKYVDPNPVATMLIENIKFESVGGNGTSLINLAQGVNDTSSLDLVFNKCIFDGSNGIPNYIVTKEQDSGYPVNSIAFNNCEILWNSSDNFVDANFNLIPEKSISKGICSGSIGTNTFGFSENRDYILTPNEFQGYGPAYGQGICQPIMSHCFSGTVSINNVPVEREIGFFRSDNDVYIGSTVSSGLNGTYYMESQYSGYHNLICLDDVTSPNYNSLIMSKCLPSNLVDD